MTDVLTARDAYKAAREQVKTTRLDLGRAIRDARQDGVKQDDIAKRLGLTREAVRRYEFEYAQTVES